MALTVTPGGNTSVFRMLSALNKIDAERTTTMTRLATGQRINRAADDPAGLIALNAMNAELTSITTAIEGNRRSESLLNVADGTLTEVGALVTEIESLVMKGLGSTATASEKAAYQAQIDSSLDAIDRLIGQAQFNGQKLFGGTNRINAYSDDASAIKDLRVYNRNPSVSGNVTLNVSVTAAATRASAVSTVGATAGDTVSGETIIQVTGKLGSATITIADGAGGDDVLAAIQAQTSITGVSAANESGSIAVMSNENGSDSFVSVSVLSGDATYLSGLQIAKTSGDDAEVTVNGMAASAQGNEVFYNGGGISLSFTLDDDTVTDHVLTVTQDGGAVFQLGTDSRSRIALGLGGMTTHELGRADIGYLSSLRSGGENSLTAEDTEALSIVRKASNQVSTMAARLGSFNKYQIGATIRSLEAAQEGMTTAASLIGDTDYTAESANLERQNILMSAAVSLLGLANSQQQNVLALLQ